MVKAFSSGSRETVDLHEKNLKKADHLGIFCPVGSEEHEGR